MFKYYEIILNVFQNTFLIWYGTFFTIIIFKNIYIFLFKNEYKLKKNILFIKIPFK